MNAKSVSVWLVLGMLGACGAADSGLGDAALDAGDEQARVRGDEDARELVHDPSRLVEEEDGWYVYGSGTQGAALTRTRVDLETGEVFIEEGLDADQLTGGWWQDVQVWNPTGEFDAPSVSADGRFLAFTVFDEGEEGIQDATGLAVRTDHGWAPGGVLLRSQGEAPGTPRAMDASFVDTTDGSFLVFGSHAGGIYITELDPETGLLLDDGDVPDTSEASERFVRIADDPEEGIEAATIFEDDGWYYLFANKGQCCRGSRSSYYVVMGRSRDIMGPYVDDSGADMVDGGGRLFLRGQGRHRGPGHVGITHTEEDTVVSVHFYDRRDRGVSKLLVRSLDWDEDGWPSPGEMVARQ
jgi:arabinan endo-1,5-alpha-L-arabinosidase